MAPQMRIAEQAEAGDAWLVACSEQPSLVREAWASKSLAAIATGTKWLAVEAQLHTSYINLYRMREEHRGPLVADGKAGLAWWLVPLDAAEELADVQALQVQRAGWLLHCPPTERIIADRMWLRGPDGSGLLNDPTVLAAAFDPGGYRLTAEAS
ncbi:hypothetical protein [Streptomyces sp. NPDC101455]|uniref:hypothetical protein n=1 Tax=Streptomyces sp. NPDC101455 TaxID=3366142 RepID=UPI0037F29951